MSAPHNKVFKLERDDDVLIVIPQGDAHGFRYHEVHLESNATLQVLDDPSLRHVIIDFGSEHVLGSIMISVVIKICRKVGTRGGKAAFCNANPDMLDVLHTMNLDRLWPYCPTREDALTSLRAG
jgi:anti-anti-sigma regulatory factor